MRTSSSSNLGGLTITKCGHLDFTVNSGEIPWYLIVKRDQNDLPPCIKLETSIQFQLHHFIREPVKIPSKST